MDLQASSYFSGRRVIVTGASSGIGGALAEALARRGARLLLVARRRVRLDERLATLPGEGHLCVAGDLTEPAVRAEVIGTVHRVWGGLDDLVNNAGVGAIGRFDEGSSEHLRQIFELNFFAAVELTRAALPLLREGKQPMIVNIGSVLARRAVPFYAEYSASKFALLGFSQALRAELAASGIAVLVVNPGTTQSEFFDSTLASRGPLGQRGVRGVPAADVAEATVRAMQRRKAEIVPSRWGKCLLWAERFAPSIVERYMRRLARRES